MLEWWNWWVDNFFGRRPRTVEELINAALEVGASPQTDTPAVLKVTPGELQLLIKADMATINFVPMQRRIFTELAGVELVIE